LVASRGCVDEVERDQNVVFGWENVAVVVGVERVVPGVLAFRSPVGIAPS
jgi:hypothetical protein